MPGMASNSKSLLQILISWLTSLTILLSSTSSWAACPEPQDLSYSVVASQPHDSNAFTQGLVFADGVLAESTGRYGHSQLILHQPGGPQTIDLPRNRFAEGLAWLDGQLWQLSWKAGEVRVYSQQPLQLQKRLQYVGEGWGLTHDGQRFILSDGSARLSFRRATDFAEIGHIQVRLGDTPLRYLNELEWINGALFANIWQQDIVARIDVESGCVTGLLRLHELWPRMLRPPQADVLNGLAWNAKKGELWVTGKLWPRLYRLKLPSLAAKTP